VILFELNGPVLQENPELSAHEKCFYQCMPLAISLTKPLSRSGEKFSTSADSAYAAAEINAYIAIRDELLTEAEEMRTRAKIDSASVANEFVLGCLKPARQPYGTQFLSETDAARQRKRCEAARDRIAKLRAAIA
jgi:hypothetical protein